MRSRKEKPIFRGFTIAVAGDLGGGQWSDANIERWVKLREGRFVRQMDDSVTHLVCSDEEFQRRGPAVRAALKRPRTCEIVTRYWLDFSTQKSKRLPEEPYSLLRKLRKERELERKRMQLIKGLELAERAVNPNLYHLYSDQTFFRYEVVLTRDDEANGIQGVRYVLTLHESNAKPHLYWFVVRFYKKKGDPQPKIDRPSNAPGLFAREFALFEFFFQIKTGIPWAQRLVKAGTTDKSLFQYTPPTGGKPVGWVPAEFLPLEMPNTVAAENGVNKDVSAIGATRTDTMAAIAAADSGSDGAGIASTPSNFSGSRALEGHVQPQPRAVETAPSLVELTPPTSPLPHGVEMANALSVPAPAA
ncbi:hypothetical protein VTK56DRAFT_10271 [Thermocarpiscus australiensis]